MGIRHWLLGSDEEPRLSRELIQRLEKLDENQRLQEKGLKSLELEWQEWFDKFRLMYARLSKRIKEAADVNPDTPQSSQDAPQSTNPRAVAYDRPLNGQRVRRNY
jgi:hypothetical protein